MGNCSSKEENDGFKRNEDFNFQQQTEEGKKSKTKISTASKTSYQKQQEINRNLGDSRLLPEGAKKVEMKDTSSLNVNDLIAYVAKLEKDNTELQSTMNKMENEHKMSVAQLKDEVSRLTVMPKNQNPTKSIVSATISESIAEEGTQVSQMTTGSAEIPEKNARRERMGISAESDQTVHKNDLPIISKSDTEKTFLKNALRKNKFFSGLTEDQTVQIINSMDRKTIAKNVEIITEGEDGDILYVIMAGKAIVSTKEDGVVATLKEGAIFGELALLYHCKRNASVKTPCDVVVYRLQRKYFQVILQTYGKERDRNMFNFISKIPKLKHLPTSRLKKLTSILEEDLFEDTECIISQGAVGDLFYIIAEGKVKVTVNQPGGEHSEKEVAILKEGDYFGERALQTTDTRSANVYAQGTVKTYSLNRMQFTNLIGHIDEQAPDDDEMSRESQIFDREDDSVEARKTTMELKNKLLYGLDYAEMSQVRVIKSLGTGGFGAVKLVYFKSDQVDKKLYALKCVAKYRIVKYKQQRHIQDEKNILFQIKSKFVLRCYKTFKDTKQVYLVTDAYLGGDLWKLLHARGPFPDTVSRFYAACVIEAFDYLHSRGIVYRDLKPENLMLHTNGYLRLVDLGFAKRVPIGSKTWTFCGTPEYIPPEVISNSGHGISADYWALGILIYELSSRKTPFKAREDLAIYSNALKGIDSVTFSYKISKKCEQIIKALCRLEPSERLGYQKEGINGIRNHRWYQGFDWKGFQEEKIASPIVPECRDYLAEGTLAKAEGLQDDGQIPEEMSGWDKDF